MLDINIFSWIRAGGKLEGAHYYNVEVWVQVTTPIIIKKRLLTDMAILSITIIGKILELHGLQGTS